MVRVGKAKRIKLVAARNSAWAGFRAMSKACARHDADRRANRPVSVMAFRDMSDLRLYMKMYEQADKLATRCGA